MSHIPDHELLSSYNDVPGPSYYGHKPLTPGNPHSQEKETSDHIESNLLADAASNLALHTALTKVFDDPGWRSQSAPVNVELLRDNVFRPKEFDNEGNEYFPCQLGCPAGVPANTGNRIKQQNRATEHVEWHLGLKRYECRTCFDTFARNQDRERHERTHKDTDEGTPCPAGCGIRFLGDRSYNVQRHLKFTCTKISRSQDAGPSTTIDPSTTDPEV